MWSSLSSTVKGSYYFWWGFLFPSLKTTWNLATVLGLVVQAIVFIVPGVNLIVWDLDCRKHLEKNEFRLYFLHIFDSCLAKPTASLLVLWDSNLSGFDGLLQKEIWIKNTVFQSKGQHLLRIGSKWNLKDRCSIDAAVPSSMVFTTLL